ncbi:hypothetical protein I7I53_05553 [Histoplasma capsulatum var. duboisii H88]|uniref:Uncharacterized protein n=1 Tax=Ajellomyces capsulatus (strain H88) TaxID=544711 RepID=A0A8A1LSD2_AJEC8|nr:hypothetical protein I7I53_05553 [Histoplasma capsulatum var. duboisii H88]
MGEDPALGGALPLRAGVDFFWRVFLAGLESMFACTARGSERILDIDGVSLSNVGDGARSLMGLTSSGRGRNGDPGDLDTTIGLGIFQGVSEPEESTDSLGGLLFKAAENEGVTLFSPSGPLTGVAGSGSIEVVLTLASFSIC